MRLLRSLALVLPILFLLASVCTHEQNTIFQIRGVWVTRWGFTSSHDISDLFTRLNSLGVNTVFFQVRGACDALYESSHEPWSSVLTGDLGKSPGWDPLGFAIEEAHRLGMELHAWVNVFPAWRVSKSGTLPQKTRPLHVVLAHPDWLACDASGKIMGLVESETRFNYVFLSPTHDGAREHIKQVVAELAQRYDIDGLHLDYIRFPDSTYSYDRQSRSSYLKDAAQRKVSFSEWRSEKLTEFVGQVSEILKSRRPQARLSAAVLQKLDDARTIYFQDGVEWVRRGYTDFLIPMIYTTDTEAFEKRLGDYTQKAGVGCIAAGIGAYLEGFTDSILVGELERVRERGALGVCVFNSDFALKYSSLLEEYLRQEVE